MSAAHYVAPEHTLLHQASKLSFCLLCACLLVSIPFSSWRTDCFQSRSVTNLSWRLVLSIALQGLRCQQLAACARQERTGPGQVRRYCLRFVLHITSTICAHIHAQFRPIDIHQMISQWCSLTKRSECVVTGASGSFTCIQCQAGTYSTGIGAHFDASCTYAHNLSSICT